MVSKFYSKINRKYLLTVWFFVWGRVNRVGWDRLFFKVWIHFICKSYQALYPLQKYPKGSCILYNGLLRIYFGLCCQHMWKETNMFTICILSWIKQIPGDNTHRKTRATVDVQAWAHQTVFPSQSGAKGTTSLLKGWWFIQVRCTFSPQCLGPSCL